MEVAGHVANQMASTIVSLLGWEVGANSVGAIAVLRKFAGLSLNEAKAMIEARLDGELIHVRVRNPQEAAELVSELKAYGFSAQQ